jgi:hypothetical protein
MKVPLNFLGERFQEHLNARLKPQTDQAQDLGRFGIMFVQRQVFKKDRLTCLASRTQQQDQAVRESKGLAACSYPVW